MPDFKKFRVRAGHTVRVERVKRNLQQRELAEKIGLGSDHLGKLERGVLPMKVEHIMAIAEAFQCPAADLLPK